MDDERLLYLIAFIIIVFIIIIVLVNLETEKRNKAKIAARKAFLEKIRLYAKNEIKQRNLSGTDIVKLYDIMFRNETISPTLIKGLHYRSDEAKNEAMRLIAGNEVELECEPDNSFDPYAVKILSNGFHIGYISKNISYYITNDIKQGGYISIVSSTDISYKADKLDNDIHVWIKLYPLYRVEAMESPVNQQKSN